MSYIVLARKWRPKRFEDVVGQEHITTTILNSIRAGRTAHAYLFVGPRGVGKTSTARILATALNCPDTKEGEPCGICDACQEIAAARSLDVIEIDGASNNSVEDIRTLRENVKIAPAGLKYKVYIIDEVHMLSTAAFNAFLKTLEEPPEHVKFLMATTEAKKIPATVLSRCQRFDFRRLTSRQIFKRLQTIVEAESIHIEEGALFAIARAAEGSMRDAQSTLDQLVSFRDANITLADVQAMLGTVGQEVYGTLAVAISEGNTFVILETIDDAVERGKDLALFLKEFTVYFRNLLVAGLGGGTDLIDLPDEDLASLKEISARFKQSDLIKMVHDLSELESRFRQLPSTRVAFEMLLMRMAHVGADVSIDNLLSKLTDLQKQIRDSNAGSNLSGDTGKSSRAKKSKRVKEPEHVRESDTIEYSHETDDPMPEEPPEEAPEESESVSTEENGKPQLDLWRQFLDEIRDQRMSIYSFLSKGRFCGIKNGEAIICFYEKDSYNKSYLERKEVKKLLDETLKSVAGNPLRLKMIIESEDVQVLPPVKQGPVQDSQAKAAEEAEKQRLQEISSNPIIKKTVKLFKGKIVYVGS